MDEELLDLERRFWEASSARDGDFYRTNVTEDALYLFPGAAGPWTREECVHRFVDAEWKLAHHQQTMAAAE